MNTFKLTLWSVSCLTALKYVYRTRYSSVVFCFIHASEVCSIQMTNVHQWNQLEEIWGNHFACSQFWLRYHFYFKYRICLSTDRSKSPKSSRANSLDRPPSESSNPFVRVGSLKAWKEEQDRIKAEEEEKERAKSEKRSKSPKKVGC